MHVIKILFFIIKEMYKYTMFVLEYYFNNNKKNFFFFIYINALWKYSYPFILFTCYVVTFCQIALNDLLHQSTLHTTYWQSKNRMVTTSYIYLKKKMTLHK